MTKAPNSINTLRIARENEEPIICYNSDFKDAQLWRKLTMEYSSKIKKVEI